MATRRKAPVPARRGRPTPPSASTSGSRTKPSKKKKKEVKKKARTLHIAALDPEPQAAIERGMEVYSIGHLTRATCKMLVNYWPIMERLEKAEEKARTMRRELERLARAHAAVDNGKKEIEEILLRYYDEY